MTSRGKPITSCLRIVMLALVAALTAIPVASAAPASAPAAAAPRQIILSTNGDLTAYGEAGGFIRFPSRTSFRLTDLWANDYCEPRADGRGIYLHAKVHLRGSQRWVIRRLGTVVYDNNSGCGNTPMFGKDRTFRFDKQVRRVVLRLCEENRSSSTKCLTWQEKTYTNPRF